MSVRLIRSLLSGHERFAVTGASGWLGRTTLELLAGALGPQQFRDQVVGFASTSRTVTLRAGTEVRLQPLHRLAELAPAPTHLLHFAYLTRNRVPEVGVPEYVTANLAITAAVISAIQRFRPSGVFTTSSGAVYGPDGYFVTDVAANPYGALKYLEELAVRCAAADAGTRSVVTRVFSLSGAYMTKPELYGLGDFLLQVLAGGPITVRATRPVERSYCAAADVVTLALACLLRGDGQEDLVFDTGGDVIEVGQLADRVIGALGLTEVSVERSWDPQAPPDRYVGDGTAMSALALTYGLPLLAIDGQIRETAAYLRDHSEL
ncbi:MAG TPA: NAD-dependent epimerase/dehydratase family protein [Acidimicrobiales bacterium]|nr:NAD-dependent epimerase/dehydratase family protein [Acidimicrobiales bacterium]